MLLWILKLLCRIFSAMPIATALAVGRGFGWVAAVVVRHRRKETIGRIQACFPGKDRDECARIYRAMFLNLGMNVIEMMRVSELGLDDMVHRVTMNGREHLDKLVSEHPGALALMAHIGNWEFCGYFTTIVEKEVTVVVKPIKNAAIQEHLEKTRENMNLRMLSHHDSFRECLRRLKKGSYVSIILDQNRSPEQGVFVDFFGQPACTSPGLALLSAQTGYPVLPIFDIRRANHVEHDVYALPPVPPPSGRKIEALTESTQTYTRIIEEMIRNHPEQWIWLHRRWRTRPSPPAAEEDDTGTPS